MKFGAVDGEGICPAKEMAFWQRANKKRLETPVTSATMQDLRENAIRKKLPAPGNRRQAFQTVVSGGQF